MAEITPPETYFVLDKQAEQEFILSQNLRALINARDEAITDYTGGKILIPSALVQLKWQNRREIYPLLIKEEVYGAVLAELMTRYPQLKNQIMMQLEASYQQIKAKEASTLMLARQLRDGTCKTATVSPVARAAAAEAAAATQTEAAAGASPAAQPGTATASTAAAAVNPSVTVAKTTPASPTKILMAPPARIHVSASK